MSSSLLSIFDLDKPIEVNEIKMEEHLVVYVEEILEEEVHKIHFLEWRNLAKLRIAVMMDRVLKNMESKGLIGVGLKLKAEKNGGTFMCISYLGTLP